MTTAILARTAATLGLALAGSAMAAVNLEFRPVTQTVNVGQTFGVGLYAVSSTSATESMSAVDVIFGWQPSFLQLLSNDNTGAVPQLTSMFISPGAFGLNEAPIPADGDGIYTGLANFGNPVQVTPAGVLLTTFRFTALAQTVLTPVDMLVSAGNPVGFTRALSGLTPNLNITGTLSGATVRIIPAPASMALLGIAGFGVLRRRR